MFYGIGNGFRIVEGFEIEGRWMEEFSCDTDFVLDGCLKR